MDWIGTKISDKYLVQALAGEGSMSWVFRAQDLTQDNRQVALKILKPDTISRRLEDIIRFRNEASLVSKLNHPRIVKIYDMGEVRHCPYLAMEWINGMDLAAWLESRAGHPNLEEALAIVAQICEGLREVHQASILHRDLNPRNIMVLAGPSEPMEFAGVKLIDFGLAQLQEFQDPQPGSAVCGTFGYVSPEQTGYLRRTPDQRSDLYSVGVIFYQLAAHCLPFAGKDFSTLVHQHIAKVPEPPSAHNRNLPKIIDRIILKLLEKEPEQRYQSAGGLLADLQKCRQGRKDFALGEEDATVKLDYHTRLIGRELPLAGLTVVYENATARPEGGLCLIHGEAGKGKTRLAEEFRDYVFAQGGTFIGGKCFSGENRIPYAVFRDVLNQYLYLYGTFSPERQERVKDKIRNAIGDLGRLPLSLNPLLQPVLGDCPPLVALEPDREHQRFLLVNSQLFYHLSRCEKPLVLFLDDLQWADEGSLSLLHELTRDLARFPLVIVAAYRDDELAPGHPLARFRAQWPAATDIALEGFDAAGMNQFLSALLHDTAEHTRDLAAFVQAKSKGNPFFAQQIVKQLVAERALVQQDRRWHINPPILDRIEISTTIVDILMQRIALLQPRETAILSCAAVIGRAFAMQTLFAIAGLPDADVVASVDQAMELQLLEPDSRAKGRILFVHDRIRDAFLRGLSPDRQRELHEAIGAALEAENRDRWEQEVFALAHHFAAAGNRAQTLRYALPAARKARTHYANEEAVNYFQLATRLLEENGEGGGGTWLQVQENIGELYLRLGKNDEAVDLFQRVLPRAATPRARAGIYKQLSQAYFKKGNWQACENFGRQGLRLLGERLPATRLGLLAGVIWEFGVHLAHNLFPRWLIRTREQPGSERYQQIMWFYYPLCWAYAFSDTLKCLRANLKILNLTEARVGPSRELFLSIGAYGGICMVAGWFRRAIHYHERALAMKAGCKDEWSRALSLQLLGFCYEFMGDYALAQDYMERCIALFRKIGDLRELGICINAKQVCHYFASDYQLQWLALEQYLDIVGKMSDDYGLSDSWHYLARSHAETGDLDEALEYARKSHDLSARRELWFVHCMACTALGVVYFEQGDLAAARSQLEKARDLYLRNRFLKHYASDVFVHLADTYQALWRQADTRQPEAKLLAAKWRRACREALRETKTWATQHSGALRVSANYHAARGKTEQARRCFAAAAALAERIGRKFEWARILFEFGVFLQHNRDDVQARRKFEAAYRLFKDIGAKGYAAKVGQFLGREAGEQSNLERLREKQRLYSIIKVSQDISSILELNKLLEAVISAAVQTTGAQRGYLLLKNPATQALDVIARQDLGDSPGRDAYSTQIVQEVLRTGEALLSTDAVSEERTRAFASVVRSALKSVLCCPIIYQHEIKGVCYLDNPLSRGVFRPEDVDILRVILTQAAISMENARLYEMAITDGLTRVVTHRHFQHLLRLEWERSQRYHHDLSLLMLDIDHFKEFNDRFGHPTGDQVLALAAGLLKHSCRSTDVVARYGGEEFAVILPETGIGGALVLAERLRDTVAKHAFMVGKNILHVTVSLGVACCPQHADNQSALIKAADAAMYISKAKGRNCVTAASGPAE